MSLHPPTLVIVLLTVAVLVCMEQRLSEVWTCISPTVMILSTHLPFVHLFQRNVYVDPWLVFNWLVRHSTVE